MRDELAGRRQQIVGFVQTSSNSSSSTSNSVQLTRETSKKASAITHLEAVPIGAERHEVIAVHHDGQIRGLSADLEKEQWASQVEGAVTVEYVFVQSAGEAKQGLLKDRADLLVFLETSGKDQDDTRDHTAIIGIIARNNNDQKRTLNLSLIHI